ncbi:TPA: shikimate dehydrogenase [Candidatus Gastranaerophilales bacterium HUM_3]|jgi:shikimate dehydrogenase|nr:shikimate dehydrogenase [Acinetobacter sp.]OLA75238.1 MAG: shikimate dehydrogenase [Acinetobacter sp. CAG:196_36_41]CCZ50481.1 shikimate dehydrogenase [Acinetobacter sp. CAG:196]DAA86692.1 MAG TPA: shikimate dehydrogenase [Candidatus Gastranaerophilales bacterium HUM_3]DAA88021.1 MAG TPA: shikimate dehydrogenase [Candidatus Gastranaerophilales bacterium HUM_4]DAA92313.1 MAG TPA: shikimate dehydrogenase [Candidatus Gastranaerophilales bacterium HUM_5]DAA98772.1 MAG TPA: shikimate dehydrogen
MFKLGIIGYPLGHSISAVIQKAGLKSIGLEGSYDVMETPPEDLINRIKFIKTNGYNGFNVTIPLKVPMSLFLDDIDDYANIAGCVNTVKVGDDKSFFGYNTDIYGFKKAIPETINLAGKNASILGTGGASRAAVVGLAEKGVKEIDFYTRNIINSRQTLEYVRAKFPEINFNVYQIQNIRSLEGTSIVVNATPIGMKGFMADQMPLEKTDLDKLNPETLIYDIVYNPVKTVLIQEAQKRGLQTVGGLDMLIYQAERAIEIWTGKSPDTKLMKIAALEAL